MFVVEWMEPGAGEARMPEEGGVVGGDRAGRWSCWDFEALRSGPPAFPKMSPRGSEVCLAVLSNTKRLNSFINFEKEVSPLCAVASLIPFLYSSPCLTKSL